MNRINKEILFSYDSEIEDVEGWAYQKREVLEEELQEVKDDINNCILGTKLYIKYKEEEKALEAEIELSDSDLQYKYENDYYKTMDEWSNSYLYDFKGNIKYEWKAGMYVLNGSCGLWTGIENVDLIKYFESFDEFFDELRDVDSCKTTYYKGGYLDWTHYHHDGSNSYELIYIDNYTKVEIKDMLEARENREWLLEYSRDNFDMTYSQLTKSDLIVILYELID